MKSNQQVGVVIADDFKTVTFQVTGYADIVLDMDKLHADIIRRAACVGMAQVRIVDAAAISMTDKSGAIIPAADRIATKHARMAELVGHYMTGTAEWSRVKASSGPKGGYLFEALCETFAGRKTPDEIRVWLDALSDKQQTALREDDTIAPVIAKIKLAKSAGQPKEDTKALLEGLTAAPVVPAPDATPTEETPTTPAP